MKEQILEMLREANSALSVDTISKGINVVDPEDMKSLLILLNEMEEELYIYKTKKNNYMLFGTSRLQVGKYIATKKDFGFVDIEGDIDVFINPTNVNGAVHGDRVVVEIIKKEEDRLEGRITRIVSRSVNELVGEYIFNEEENISKVVLDEEKIKLQVLINREIALGAVNGHKVLVKLLDRVRENIYNGEIIKIIGHKEDPGVDILSIAYKFEIEDDFSKEVIDDANKVQTEVTEKDIVGRKDLRNEDLFTIDSESTKDIDDAISIKKLDNGNYLLGVHIADVSYYVTDNSELNKSAYSRGTSVYLANRVIPMYPHILSNGICSLNPNVDRLAISCEMEINHSGDVIEANIFESVIKSKKQMTYTAVNSIIMDDVVPEGYEEYEIIIRNMADLAGILRRSKVKRGYIDFEVEEAEIVVDSDGKAIDVVLRERGDGEKLIEDFMIVANETVASHIYFMELPFVYRVHDEPSEERITQFMSFVSGLGYTIKGNIKKFTPKIMQDILRQLKDKKEFHILSSLLLRSMRKAVYDSTNIGHFGLGSKCYTHFTSPIRRYPDTTVHRLLRKYLFEGNVSSETIAYWERELPELTLHSSEKERNSVECEREVDDMKKAEYMEGHIGESFDGMISGVTKFGLFVQLPNLIEGLIRIDDLDGYYNLDEVTMTLRSKNNKRGYRLGDDIRVTVKSASKEAHTIDFIIAKGDEDGSKKQKS